MCPGLRRDRSREESQPVLGPVSPIAVVVEGEFHQCVGRDGVSQAYGQGARAVFQGWRVGVYETVPHPVKFVVDVAALTCLASFDSVPFVSHDIGRSVRVGGFVFLQEAAEITAYAATAPEYVVRVGPEVQPEASPWLLR